MSLRRQTVPPAAVWVIADNCTDATEEVARDGADVYTTVENRHRKAGGLNQLLARLLPPSAPWTRCWSWTPTQSWSTTSSSGQ